MAVALAPWLNLMAFVVAVAAMTAGAGWRGLDAREAYRAAVVAALAGAAGGGILSGLVHGAWLDQSFFGVLAGGALAGAVTLRFRRLPLMPYADAAAPAVALGYATARVGCFLNGDDFGATTTAAWGVVFPPGTEAWAAHADRGWIAMSASSSLPVVPIQLLLAGVGLTVFATLYRRRLRPGMTAGSAAVAYGLARLALEPLRDDFSPVLGPLALPQLLALALMVCGAALLVAADRAGRPVVARARTDRVESRVLT